MKAKLIQVHGKPQWIACEHWKNFPPPTAFTGLTAQQLRSQGVLNDAETARMETWARVCGLTAMEEEKCNQCPHRCTIHADHLGLYIMDRDGKKVRYEGVTPSEYRQSLVAAAASQHTLGRSPRQIHGDGQ